ncbi:MAG: hypothetical protein GXP31_03425 [Kiritimatiellaeota bacterium]|nr:hypothetical protein [Kiritimatiellota bacterium]
MNLKRILLAFVLCAGNAVCAPATLPPLSIVLGPENRGAGLSAPSAGDGVNVPETVAGATVRRIGPGSRYLYVRIDDAAYEKAAPVDLYVAAEVLDDGFRNVTLQYDKAAPKPNLGTKYTAARGAALLLGRGGVRTLFFFLPRARVGHGQNHGADFRLCAAALAVRRITVTTRRPKGFALSQTLDPATLTAFEVKRPPGMELTFGNDADETEAALLRAISATSVESYVDWAGVEPKKEGGWDWSKWDRQVDILRRHGLKWVPFLIAGPAYATPLWWHDSPYSHYFRCLEHGKESKVQSLFNPDLPRYIERFLRTFAARYRDSGVIESVLLGVSGIYGESIYPAGPTGGWTARLTGAYHNHAGWWADDPFARIAFRRAMRRKYFFLFRLNRAWGRDFRSWNDVSTFLPDKAPNDRARADLAQWYQQAMTDWAEFWVRTTRRHFPRTEIYLCTGGNGRPLLGADFTAQAKAIAPYGAGIRITNEASDLAANFTVTREVATATRLYGVFAGFEPAGRVDARGVVARVFNATASGVRQLHYYKPNLFQAGDALRNFREFAPLLVPRDPLVTTAFYVSRETWEVDPSAIHPMYAVARRLRDVVDYDMVTRCSVRDGVLRGHRALILVESDVLEPESARRVRRWVERGGLLIAATRPGHPLAKRLYDLEQWRERLFPGAVKSISDKLLFRTLAPGSAPVSWRLELGRDGDGDWIFGDWHKQERGLEWPRIPDARKRWSGARSGILLPTRPGAAYRLRIDAYLPSYARTAQGNTVRINGAPVGRLDRPGAVLYEFTVPKDVVGGSALARLELDIRTWVPAECGDSTDRRRLGVAVRTIEWVRKGAGTARFGVASIRWTVDRRQLRKHARRVGKGWSVLFSGLGAAPDTFARVAGLLLGRTGSFLPELPAVFPEDGRLDGVYTTRTLSGAILRYDADRARITIEGPSRAP